MGEFKSTTELVEEWAAKLPGRRFDAEGVELLTSRMRRAAVAHRLEQEATPDEQAKLQAERRERDAAERKVRCVEMEVRYFAEMPDALRGIGLEPQEANALAALETREAVRAALGWWESGKLFLCLGGRPGTGKTVAAASLLPQAAVEHVACESVEGRQWATWLARFTKAQELARMSLYGDETRKRLDRLKRVGLLVIDDLGAESKSDAWWALCDELVDARARQEVRTVATTNLSSAQLRERYGERVFRRLKDFGQFVAVDGPKKPEAEA